MQRRPFGRTRSDDGPLKIGSPSDSLEREADRIADEVTRSRGGTDLQVSRDADAEAVRRTPVSPYSMSEGTIVDENDEPIETEEERGEDEGRIQAKAGPAVTAGPATSARVNAVVRRPGTPLPEATRTYMEGRLGHDFSRVRIHADAQAAEAAESIDARAFTRGADVVFARGQYSPHSQAGNWLLAHELAHVVQQERAPALDTPDQPTPEIAHRDRSSEVRRVKWSTARDTGRDSFPWGTGPKGDVYEVETDAGRRIPVWKPHNGSTYWCHGYTFGGARASGGPFSIWGQDVPAVLSDEGWTRAYSCVAQRNDILVFAANNVAHSGIVHSTSEPGGIVDENASELDSKWGQLALNRSSWAVNVAQYGRYQVFSKQPAYGPCAGKGANES